MAASLLANWSTLHGGGDGGSCTCALVDCIGEECKNMLPWNTVKPFMEWTS